MNSRRFSSVLAFAAVALFATIGAFGLLAPHAHAAQQLYTCGMHPQIIKTEPGNCPICGMKLTPVRANAKAAPAAAGEVDAAAGITIDPVTIQKMNLKTAVVQKGPVRRALRAVGAVSFNEQGLTDITTKYEGWIEKLFVNATWVSVKAGAPLFEIYSPDLYNAQLNFVVALRTEGSAGGPLTNAARARLMLFDVPGDFVTELARTGEARRTIVYRAPADGIVIEKPAVQGMMVKPGEKIFRLADLSTVWVTAQIYEKDLALVQAGQEAIVRSTYGGEHEFRGKVDLLLPEVAAETRTVQARLAIPNRDFALKPGMFVDVRFEAELAPSALLVPDIAVLRSGERNTVFVARDGGTFEPREVKLGARTADNSYEVLAGLADGDRVVTSGQFMLDSESQLREAIQKMTRLTGATASDTAPAPSATKAPAADAASPVLSTLALAAADAAKALAADDVTAYGKQLPALRAALTAFVKTAPASPVAKFSETLKTGDDLKAARREFEPFSTAVADLAREHHLHHTAGLHVFECPMAPVLGKGRWLQREPGTKNPFFGSKMLRCGEELDATPPTGKRASLDAPAAKAARVAGKLPAGHPPIAAMSIAQFVSSQTGLPRIDGAAGTAPGATCGSCGMSAAAMAAGEPCETGAER